MPGAKFIPKELRQIEHFLNRETNEELEWWLNRDCDGACCVDEDVSLEMGLDLADYLPELPDKFEKMAKKYNLHVTTDWSGGYIYAAKKGVNDGSRN